MTEMLRQSLSAAVDDEADAFELRRVLDELDRDPQLREAWARYHLIGAVMRGERRVPGAGRSDGDLGERVWHALSAPPAEAAEAMAGAVLLQGDAQPSRRRWVGRTTALAVAASAAFAVVIGFDALQSPPPSTAPAVAVEAPVQPIAVPVVSGPAIEERGVPRLRQASEVSASDVRRAHAYMLRHAQHQALNQSGVMSLVKMATYEKP